MSTVNGLDGSSAPTFLGYRRPNGRVGVRNHLLVLSASIYANATCQRIANSLRGAVAVTHPLGRCQVSSDLRRTYETLVGTAVNPNVGAGCATRT